MNVEFTTQQLFEMVRCSILGTLSEKHLRKLAHRLAKERVEANINIGNFIYNTNLARTLLIKLVHQADLPLQTLQYIVEVINQHFDRFCYYAVTKYTELKNQELHEQRVFLNEAHKDRLSLLGQMSSSFVHEFRNPLTSVIGFIKLLKADHPDLKYLDIISHKLDQLKFRITQFLHTSKVKLPEKRKQQVVLIHLFDDILDFVYPSIVDGDVKIVTDVDTLLAIEANRDELKQVFLNILLNSIDAVKTRERPREIRVSTQLENDQAVIRISNNGPIIPPRIRNVIFEPFYTTKELGTGIGLYVCKKIIELHGGTITCSSTQDLTMFTITLPTCSPTLAINQTN